MIWTKPPGNYVPAINLQGCNFSETKKRRFSFNVKPPVGFFGSWGTLFATQELTWLLELCFKWKAIRWGENGPPRIWRPSWRMRRMPTVETFNKCWSRWFFQIFLEFSSRKLGKIPILTNIFQMGWNHQLAGVFTLGHLCLPRCSQAIAF